ncbi:MAG: hypothetical protein WA816_03665 [Bacteroidales bacterium]
MNRIIILIFGLVVLLSVSCSSLGKLTRHDFESGFYKLKVKGAPSSRVYTEVAGDSIIVYPVTSDGKNKFPNTSTSVSTRISRIKKDNYFYKSSFTNNSIDIDLTSIIFKSRHSRDDVPNQFSADLDIAVYAGFRKDFYNVISSVHPFHEDKSFIRQIGFDLGVFAGIGSSPVNPTVTNNLVSQEYDAMIFQKGFAGFISINKISVGVAVGFDNLIDKSRYLWIYNQKPYLGLIISVSGF